MADKVQTKDLMPADQRKLADRINVNEIMQMQDDQRAGGFGTSRELMPDPPVTVPMITRVGDFARGGKVLKRT